MIIFMEPGMFVFEGDIITQFDPIQAGSYTIVYVVTSPQGCSDYCEFVIVVNPLPVVFAGEDQVIPYNTSAIIGDALVSGTEPFIYSWVPADLLLDPSVLNPTTIDLNVDTTFTLTVTDGGGCQSSDQVTIFIDGGPLEIDPYVDHPEICPGRTVQLFANATGGLGVYTYIWTSIPPGFTSYEANPTANPVVTTTYFVEVTDGNDTLTDSVTVFVYALPKAFAGEDQTIQYGTGTIIQDAVASGIEPLTYSWMPAGFLIDATVLNPTTIGLETTTTFVLTVTDGNGCENNDDVTIFIDGNPLEVNPTAVPAEICPGGSVQLFANATGGSGVYTYSWQSDPPGFTSTEENPWDTPASSTIYIVEVYDGYNLVSGNVAVTVNLLPVVTCPDDFKLLVNNAPVTLIGGNPAGGTYSGPGVTDGVFDPSVAGIGDWEITYNYQDSITGCENYCTFNIEVRNIILNHLDAITGADNHCMGNAAIVPLQVDKFTSVAVFQLKLSYNVDNLLCEGYRNVLPQLEDKISGFIDQAAGEITLNWQSDIPVTFNQIETVLELVFTPKQPFIGQLEWYTGETESYFSDNTGLPILADFFTEQITIYNPPEIMLAESINVCEGEELIITSDAISSYPPVTYEWTYPDGQIYTSDPSFSYVTQADAGIYTLLATDLMGCDDQKSIRLIVNQNPQAAFHGIDTLAVPYGYILEAGNGFAFYLWNTGETTDDITITKEGMYRVDIESFAGCIGTDSVYILFPDDDQIRKCLFFPNAFTPNNDGLNDTFLPISICDDITDYRMMIFNRWGEMIFKSNEVSLGWDGRKNGIRCPNEVYVYMVTYQTGENLPGVDKTRMEVGVVVIVK